MSAPDTNIEKQTDRHRPALLGMGAAGLWAGGLLVAFLIWLVANGSTPEDEGPQVEVMPGVGATLEEN